MTNQEAIAIGTERFLENNKELVFAAIERGTAKAAMSVAESVGILTSGKVERFLATHKAEIIAALRTQMAMSNVVENISANRREPPAFDLSKG